MLAGKTSMVSSEADRAEANQWRTLMEEVPCYPLRFVERAILSRPTF